MNRIARQLPPEPEVVVICGVPFRQVRVMVSAYEGTCMQTGKTIRKGDLMVFKSNTRLTDEEYSSFFRQPSKLHIVALYDEVEVCTEAQWRARNPIPVAAAVPAKSKKGELARQKPQRPKFAPSPYQQIILDSLWTSKRHLLVNALAGCAKTSTIQLIAWALRDKKVKSKTNPGEYVSLMRGRTVVYLAYGKRLKKEVEPKLFGTGVRAYTTHGFCLAAMGLSPDDITEAKILDRDRLLAVVCNMLGLPFNEGSVSQIKKDWSHWILKNSVIALVAFAKHWAVAPEWNGTGWAFSQQSLDKIESYLKKYRIIVPKIEDEEPEDTRAMVVRLAAATICSSLPRPGDKPTRVTFEDLLYMPVVLDLPLPPVNMGLVDEVQDFNMCQILLMKKLAEGGAKLIMVGDPRQGICYFRGATGKSFEYITEYMSATERGLDHAILPINYRSSRAGIKNAKRWEPSLQGFRDFEGEVRADVDMAGMFDWLSTQPTRSVVVLCRTNAPLFQAALELLKEFIRRGIADRKVCILGKKGVGAPLIHLIHTVTRDEDGNEVCTTIANVKDENGEVVAKGLLERINEYVARQLALWGEDEQYQTAIENLNSNVECIRVVCEMVSDDKVSSAIKTINSLVTDEPEEGCISFSTIHTAKGLEWETVFVIRPDLSPFPTVQMVDENGDITEEGQEELNLMYVRDTRLVDNQYYVTDWIEKDRMSATLDVHAFLGEPEAIGSEIDAEDFWDRQTTDDDIVSLPPPVPYIPSGERIRREARLSQSAQSTVVSEVPKPMKALEPPIAVVKPQNRRTWVDNGMPF